MKIQLFLLPISLILLIMGLPNISSMDTFGQQLIESSENKTDGWKKSFSLDECNFSSIGYNDYMILIPGHQLILEGKEDATEVQLSITILNDTKTVNGVETRIVEEKKTEDGKLDEIAKNYFVICKPSNDIFNFGEEVDYYENGKIISHEGAWEAGVNGSKPGIVMPGKIELNSKYYQENGPGIAEDRSEIISMTETVNTPAGTFDKVIKSKETNPLEPNSKDYKFYVKGIGFIKEESFKLIESPHSEILTLVKFIVPN